MRKYFLPAIFVVFLSVILLYSATPALAILPPSSLRTDRMINRASEEANQASRTANRETNDLTRIKQRAGQMVTNRINELNRLLTRIQNDKRLSSADKASLSSDVQSAISGLNQLKAKIDADTDVQTARSDAKQIVTNFRIFEMLVPKMQLLITIANLQSLAANIQTLTPKLQELINNLKSQGKDVAALQSLLDDVNNQLQTINSKLAADKSAVLGVSVTTLNPRTTFVKVRQDLAIVRQDFAKIRADIARMREAFKGTFKIKLNARPSISPAATLTPTLTLTPTP